MEVSGTVVSSARPRPSGSRTGPSTSSKKEIEHELAPFDAESQLAEAFFELSLGNPEPPAVLSDHVADDLETLYNTFLQTAPSVDLKLSHPTDDSSDNLDDAGSDLPETISLSRAQHSIVVEEGSIWGSLSAETDDIDAAIRAADELASRSEAISRSYGRKAELPTEQTFSEIKILIEAMGVAVIASQGPFEAEGLASSMVKHGLADYVASEDTVRILRYLDPFSSDH